MTERLHLSPKHRAVIETLLQEHLPGVEVWAYGSRVNGRSHDGSDLDLVLRGPGLNEIPLDQLGDFEEAVRDSAIPFLVEARDWAWLPERFHREIERGYVVLVENEKEAVGGEWREVPVSQVTSAVIGGTPARSAAEYWGGDVPWATAKDVAAVSSRYLDQVQECITEQGLESSAAKLMSPGTVIITARGTVGAIAQLRREMTFNQTCYAILPKHGLDGDFLFWALKGTLSEMRSLTHGTVFETITTRTFDNWRIPLPPLPEQRAIAHILGTLDDKIELNRRMNETLEAMARALFKSWFVDFDPVRAKAALRNHAAHQSATSSQGKRDWSVERARAYLDQMDPEIAALFPDRFVDSELGEIPAGWKVEQFEGHMSAQRGLSYAGSGLCGQNEGLPMHNLNSIFEGGGYKHDGIKYYKGEYRKKHSLKPGDLIVTNTEQGFDRLLIGHAAIVPDNFGPTGLYSHHIYRIEIRPSSPLTPSYLCRLFNGPRWHSWISGFSNGTTINMLPKDAFEIPLLVISPAELVDEFTTIDRNTLAKKESNHTESRALAALRDALLPRLVSGEVRVGHSTSQAN